MNFLQCISLFTMLTSMTSRHVQTWKSGSRYSSSASNSRPSSETWRARSARVAWTSRRPCRARRSESWWTGYPGESLNPCETGWARRSKRTGKTCANENNQSFSHCKTAHRSKRKWCATLKHHGAPIFARRRANVSKSQRIRRIQLNKHRRRRQ